MSEVCCPDDDEPRPRKRMSNGLVPTIQRRQKLVTEVIRRKLVVIPKRDGGTTF